MPRRLHLRANDATFRAMACRGGAKRQAVCPCCEELRDVDAETELRAAEARWMDRVATHWRPAEDVMRSAAARDVARTDGWLWACDWCFRDGLAIRTDVTRQVVELGLPHAAYFSCPFRCEDCGTEAVFSAEDQQRWYEVLGLLNSMRPTKCATHASREEVVPRRSLAMMTARRAR